MANTWILVANAANAVLYLNEGPGKGRGKGGRPDGAGPPEGRGPKG